MPHVYLVIDHWSNFEELLYSSGVRRFFVTRASALESALKRGCDIIVDNGTYWRGRPDISLCLMAAKKGLKYIMPDIVGDPKKTIEMHLKFADMVSEKELSNGFTVLQCNSIDECLEVLDEMQGMGLVKKYVAFGGSLELRRKRSIDEKITTTLYSTLSKKGIWLHVLGRARWNCHSFDTASWGYRMLDQKLRNKKYDVKPVLDFIKKYESHTPENNTILDFLKWK